MTLHTQPLENTPIEADVAVGVPKEMLPRFSPIGIRRTINALLFAATIVGVGQPQIGFLKPATAQALTGQKSWKFDFGPGKVEPGYTQVLPTALYGAETGFGFEPGATLTAQDRGKPDALRGDLVTSDKPFRFSVALPEGNYNIKVTLGDQIGASNTTVKAEARRLMVESVQTMPGQFTTRTFTVNVHTPKIAEGKEVRLNARETGPPLALNWDEKLTLEFNGPHPSVTALEITPAENVLGVFLAGDSTVTDQQNEPYAAWGQMLPRFFKPEVAVSNYAESGLALRSFKSQRRQEKLLSAMKPGDYVFIQFGHNDQKDKTEGAGPFTSYKTNLKDLVTQVKGKGGLPIVVSPMERRRWSKEGKPEATLADYAEAVRQVGKEESVPVIDLNAMSLKFYEFLGEANSKKAFAYAAVGELPGLTTAVKDNTHFSNYGAYELARSIVEGIKANVPSLAKFLVDDVKLYDPSKPDPVEGFDVPASPYTATEKPAGS